MLPYVNILLIIINIVKFSNELAKLIFKRTYVWNRIITSEEFLSIQSTIRKRKNSIGHIIRIDEESYVNY